MLKFGTDGWRAVISEEFTFENVRQVAQAIAGYLVTRYSSLVTRPLIIGYDARFLADKFAEEVARVMLANGISCLLTERDTPTPVVAWEVRDKKAAGAVMLTASHNPPQYCGIKFIPDYAGPANEKITSEIEKNIMEPSRTVGAGSAKLERFEPRERYLKYIESFVDASIIRKAKLKVVVDPMHGSGRGYLDKLLQRMGGQVEEIHNYRDVLFGGMNPEPDDENLEELEDKVVENKADLGLALDGDADRFGMVDDTGKFYSADQIISLLFEYLVTEKGLGGWALPAGRQVVRSIGTTHLIDRIANQHQIKVIETPVGFKYIAKEMLEKDVILGGEESGGFTIKGHILEKDGILANLLVVEMVARRRKPLAQIWKDLIQKFGEVYNQRVKLRIEEKEKFMQKLKTEPPREFAGQKVKETNFLDGLKIILADGSWGLVRPSGTEPLIRVYAESDKPEKVDRIIESIKNLI